MRRLLFALASVAFLAPSAMAQDIEDLDEGGRGGRKKDRREVMARLEDEVIREIVRGFYIKAGAGGGAYFGRYGGILSSVVTTPLTFGQDFLDAERSSMAWELSLTQAVYNGASYESQNMIQGDTRFFNVTAAIEYSGYPARRLGLGVRAGGGIMFAPLLMERTEYETTVVQDTWGGVESPAHTRPHPTFFAGPTLEYYTKLSHFSIGLDIDVAYQIDFDINLSGVGWFKYTF